jgi:drug/metabolite transporter (DMT)-like permease
MVLSQFMGEVDPYTKTIVQLGVAGLALLPQVAMAGLAPWMALGPRELALLAVVCLVHTGVAFVLWFSSLHELPAQKVAVFNYIDPAVALLSSALVLGERMTPLATVGAVLILGSTLASELLESAE